MTTASQPNIPDHIIEHYNSSGLLKKNYPWIEKTDTSALKNANFTAVGYGNTGSKEK